MKNNNWLSSFEKNIYSQNGEDGIIEKIFEIIKSSNKWCVEFGASDGEFLSNTRNLIKNKGWKGVMIEPEAGAFEKLAKNYSGNSGVFCLNKAVNFEGEDALDDILAKTPIDKNFDFLSIDIDGNDYHIWDSINVYHPKVVAIEFNSSIPSDIVYIQKKDLKVNQGSSLLALCNLANKKGYELVAATSWNAFFVRKEFFGLFEITNNSPAAIFKNTQYLTRIYQLYDGSIIIDGYKKMFWHGVELYPGSLNPIPKIFRQYPGAMSPFKFLFLRIWRKSYKIIKEYF